MKKLLILLCAVFMLQGVKAQEKEDSKKLNLISFNVGIATPYGNLSSTNSIDKKSMYREFGAVFNLEGTFEKKSSQWTKKFLIQIGNFRLKKDAYEKDIISSVNQSISNDIIYNIETTGGNMQFTNIMYGWSYLFKINENLIIAPKFLFGLTLWDEKNINADVTYKYAGNKSFEFEGSFATSLALQFGLDVLYKIHEHWYLRADINNIISHIDYEPKDEDEYSITTKQNNISFGIGYNF